LTVQPPAGEEGAVVARVLAGDHAAFEELVSRYHRVVFAIAFRMTGNRAEAEDVSQDVFLRIFRSLDQFDPRLPLAPWVRRIASNAALNHLRRRNLERRHAPPPLREENAPDIPDAAADPERRAAGSEVAGRLARALDGLPENQRMAVTLKYVEDLTAEEIAQAMGAPRNTVKTWLLRARERLREELKHEL
jgi:RNA polymerase sigma-70 factor, ECF subfamily